MQSARRLAFALIGIVAIGCSPVFDWRETRSDADAAGVVVLFPCRPIVQSRSVQLVGKAVSLNLRVCTVGGVTWALAAADMGDPRLVSPALQELARLARANLSGQSTTKQPFVVTGSTPNDDAVRELIVGALPDGRAVVEHLGVFSRATWVLQLTALGVSPSADAVETFFDSVRVSM